MAKTAVMLANEAKVVAVPASQEHMGMEQDIMADNATLIGKNSGDDS